MSIANLFNTTQLMTFTQQAGSGTVPLPQFAQHALDAADEQDFARLFAESGAECIERYGDLIEGLEVWRLQPKQAGWLALHFDGDAIDMVIYITSTIDYAAFQAGWLAPMAQKIIAAERYFQRCHEQHESAKMKVN
jgi:hypothetical protein